MGFLYRAARQSSIYSVGRNDIVGSHVERESCERVSAIIMTTGVPYCLRTTGGSREHFSAGREGDRQNVGRKPAEQVQGHGGIQGNFCRAIVRGKRGFPMTRWKRIHIIVNYDINTHVLCRRFTPLHFSAAWQPATYVRSLLVR